MYCIFYFDDGGNGRCAYNLYEHSCKINVGYELTMFVADVRKAVKYVIIVVN
jgi:hypothetical protein